VHDNTYTTWEARRAYFDQLLRKASATLKLFRPRFPQMPPRQTTAGNSARGFRGSRRPNNNERVSTSSVQAFLRAPHSVAARTNLDESETNAWLKARSDQSDACSPIFSERQCGRHQIRVPQLKGEPPSTGGRRSESWFQVVGIVGDARDDEECANPIKPSVFVPYTIMMPVWTQILVRPGSRLSRCFHGSANRFTLLT